MGCLNPHVCSTVCCLEHNVLIGLKILNSTSCVLLIDHVTLLCYVDDPIVTGADEEDLRNLKALLTVNLAANDLRKATDFLVIRTV